MKNSYKFFQNKDCEFFPCHKTKDESNFNCLFCYCPLYQCECKGQCTTLENGVKDCSNCTIPHHNYDYIINRLKEYNENKN